MAIDIVAVLGLGRHIVLPSERFFTRPLVDGRDALLTREDGEERVREVLAGLDGIVVIERTWNPRLAPAARALGLAMVCVPMWEWFNPKDPDWALCHRFFCPNEFSAQTIRSLGFSQATFVPWTLDLARLPAKPWPTGHQARVFFHNAGWIDEDDRKGTLDTVRAFEQVKGSDLRLIVRAQTKKNELTSSDPRIEFRAGNLATTAELYAEGDVAVQPSKMEGLGFMVLEPVCSGVPVITIDYPPMSEFVRQPELRVKKRWWKRKAFASHWIKHAHLRLPSGTDLAHKLAWAAGRDLSGIATDNRAWAEQTFSVANLRDTWARELGACTP